MPGGASDAQAAAAPSQGACNASSPQPEAQLSLADLPAAWLRQLIALLGGKALCSLLGTCRATRDLLLRETNFRLRARLPMPATRARAAAWKCLVAECRPENIILVLSGEAEHSRTASEDQMLMSRAMAAATALDFTAIKSVELQGLTVDALVPSWLTSTCPNMTSLTLHSCRFMDLPAPTTPIPVCSQLKHLGLNRMPDGVEQINVTSSEGRGKLQVWQHQLRALRGLQSVSITVPWPKTEEHRFLPTGLDLWLDCVSAIGSQLTQLSLATVDDAQLLGFGQPPWGPRALFNERNTQHYFPNLVQLHLPGIKVYGWVLDELASIRSIRQLHCQGIWAPDRTWQPKPWPWVHLGVQLLCIASFANLPLEGLQSLQAVAPDQRFTFVGSNCEDTDVARRAVAAISNIPGGGLQWGDIEEVCVDGGPPACAAALLPLLSSSSSCQARRLTLALQPSAELLASLQPHLSSPHLQHIRFMRLNTVFEQPAWPEEVWRLLLPSLPPQVHTVSVSTVTEGQFRDLCMHACRPIRVEVQDFYKARAEWAEQVAEAVAVAGHPRVTVATWHNWWWQCQRSGAAKQVVAMRL